LAGRKKMRPGFGGGLAFRRRQFVIDGTAVVAGVITASRAEGVPVPNASDPILDAIEEPKTDEISWRTPAAA
jgi:hypothetical protein